MNVEVWAWGGLQPAMGHLLTWRNGGAGRADATLLAPLHCARGFDGAFFDGQLPTMLRARTSQGAARIRPIEGVAAGG